MMDKRATLACVLLLAGVAIAHPGSWQRRASEDSPDHDVEAVEPVRGGGSRGRGGAVFPAEASDEGPKADEPPVNIGFGLRGVVRGLGGYGGLGDYGGYGAIRPVIIATRDSAEDSDEELPGGLVPTGFLNPIFVDPMSNFMAQMAEMMAAMRRQMTQVLSRGGVDSEAGPDFSKLGNTTSTTKVVDGHVVTVNETVIGGEDGDSSVLHVRVVDIRPTESPADAESPSQAVTPSDAEGAVKDNGQDRDVEPLESSNEVTAQKPSRSNSDVPMKVGSEVDDLNG